MRLDRVWVLKRNGRWTWVCPDISHAIIPAEERGFLTHSSAADAARVHAAIAHHGVRP
jgi:hypothetical protein